jgi:tetratricopeptide (TPR) repeat protein
MRLRSILIVALLSAGSVARGQSAEQEIALGDRDHAAHDLSSALAHYEAAIRAEPSNYVALIKAAQDAVDLGEFDDDHKKRDSLYKSAEQYARRAVAANPNAADGHFELARAIGRNALTMGTRDRIKYAREVREQTLDALKIDSTHAGALHVMGVWNAEVMRLNGLSRLIAKNFLGGKVFGDASWDNAQRYLERAVALEPNRITHRLDLGAVYADRGQKAKATEQYEAIGRLSPSDYNDARYKTIAQQRLAALR